MLDLFVANYLVLDLADRPRARARARTACGRAIPVNCGPKGLPTDTNLLFHNEGDGRFRDVSEASGVARSRSRYPMTAAAADFDGDGWADIYVACDSTASILYRNSSDGTFTRRRGGAAAPPTASSATRRRAWAWRWTTTTATGCSTC